MVGNTWTGDQEQVIEEVLAKNKGKRETHPGQEGCLGWKPAAEGGRGVTSGAGVTIPELSRQKVGEGRPYREAGSSWEIEKMGRGS